MSNLREAIARRVAAKYARISDWREVPDDVWRAILPTTDSYLAAIEAAGWQIVPQEATRKMSLAANKIGCDRYGPDQTFYVTFGEFECMWRNALAAAPKPGGEK